MRNSIRASISCLAAILAASAFAGTITIVDPSNGDYLGKSNTVKFNISGASALVTVNVRLEQVADPTVVITTQREFTPDTDGKIAGSITLNLSEGLANGAYTLTITPTEPGGVYNVVPPINVIVDVKDPKFLQFNPINAGFVKGTVLISSLFAEDNMKEWRVQVNGSDIPNNTGNNNTLGVTWDSSLETNDGTKSISITAEDEAGNKATQNISVTLDRIAPSATVLAPTGNEPIFGNARVPVIVQVNDQFNGSVDSRTIDVVIEDLSGNFLARVARRAITNNGPSVTWSGRIRDISSLPSSFNIAVYAMDKAGNMATDQKVRVDQGRSRGLSTLVVGGSSEPAVSESVREVAKLWFNRGLSIGSGVIYSPDATKSGK